MLDVADLRRLAEGLDHPEGVTLGLDGALYAGGEAGQYRIDPDAATHEQVANTEAFVLGLAADASGAVYVCDSGRAAVLRVDPSTGAVDSYCEAAGGNPLRLPNWPAFDADGGLWVSDSGAERLDACEGVLVRVPPGGGDGEIVDLPPLHFPSGLCIAAVGPPTFSRASRRASRASGPEDSSASLTSPGSYLTGSP
jgi:sugar lactone lactonase YvrE